MRASVYTFDATEKRFFPFVFVSFVQVAFVCFAFTRNSVFPLIIFPSEISVSFSLSAGQVVFYGEEVLLCFSFLL